MDEKNPIWLRRKKQHIVDEMNGIVSDAEKDERPLAEEEIASLNQMRAEVISLDEQIDLIEAIPATDQEIHETIKRADSAPAGGVTHGHKADGALNLGEFAMGCRDISRGSNTDLRNRVYAAATTYGSEGVGVDGGYLVPVDERTTIKQTVEAESQILPLVDQVSTTSDTFSAPTDDTTPWGSSGQILAYWDSEGASYTASKPNFGKRNVSIDKLTCLVPVTDELMMDAPTITSYLRRKVTEIMAYKINRAICAGTGVGEPLGILNSSALISTTKTGSQDADSFVGMNAVNAWQRLYDGDRGANVRWLANPNTMAEIMTAQITGQDVTGTEEASGTRFLYGLPGTPGNAGAPMGSIFMVPIIFTQACEVLGDAGDVYLAALARYLMVLRTPAPQEAMSIHLYFDQSITAFRFVWRLGGMPWRNSTITGRDGTTTYSPFVTTAVRG